MILEFNAYIVLTLFTIFLLLVIVNKWYGDKHRLFFSFAIFVYLCALVAVVFFPIAINGDRVSQCSINLKPFKYGFSYMDFLNIIMTMPIGILLPLIGKLRLKTKLELIFLNGLVIEGSQWLIGKVTGTFLRVVDINDYICNTLGVAIGFIIIGIFGKIFILYYRKKELTGLKIYLYNQFK